MTTELPLLSLLIWLPVIGGAWVLFAGSRAPAGAVRADALLISLATLALSLPLWAGYQPEGAGMQFVEKAVWIGAFDIHYHLGVDGIAVPLILLTTLTTVLVVLAGWESIRERVNQYMAAFLILEGLMIGVFSALDAVLFYVFWEAMLIPMFLIIGMWGGERRVYAAVKFFLYTFLGSVLMLIALLYMYFEGDSFAIADLHALDLTLQAQTLIFLAFFAAFAVKVPMWPVHTWLPDAHVEAPTGGSVVLAAIMLKMGGYGFLRFSLPIAPDAAARLADFVIALSLIAIVYIGFVALVQRDMKKLIAYSSISHMGFVTLGFFAVFRMLEAPGGADAALLGMTGGMVQMISHGFISGALFLCVGVLYDRVHSRQIADYGGVANTMPRFAALFMLFAMANSGLPGTSGFVGEFMVILASFKASPWIALAAALTLVLGAAYTLWMYKRVVFGAVASPAVAALADLERRELLILAVLAALVLLVGVWPAPLVDVMTPTLENLLSHVADGKLAR